MTDPLDPVALARSEAAFARRLAFAKAKHRPPARHRRRQRAVVAAGKAVETERDRTRGRATRADGGWQEEAWRYYEQLGEIRYAATFCGQALSRLRLVPAIQVNPDEPPVPIDQAVEDGISVPQGAVLAAQQIVRALRNEEQGLADLLYDFGVNDFVAGESFLVGLDGETDSGETIYHLASVSEVSPGSDGLWHFSTAPTNRPKDARALGPEDVLVRLWTPHPRWHDLADSPVRGVLDFCEELQLLTRAIRATAMSRLPAGILVYPLEADDGGPEDGDEWADAEDPSWGQGRSQSTLADDLVAHMTTPIGEPGAASAIVPFLFGVASDDVDKVKLIEVARDVDRLFGEQRTELIRRIATSVDLPPEVLLGMADVNHWTAWQIGDDTFRSHIAPRAGRFCSSLTAGWFRPSMRAVGVDDARIVLWYDPSDLVQKPDRSESATEGVRLGLLSEETWRREHAYTDEDAPTDEEIERRVALGLLGSRPTPAAPEMEPAPAETGPPDLTAAAVRFEDLGERLAQMDRTLLDRMLVLCDAATRRAVEKAGGRLRTKVLKAGLGIQEVLRGLPADQVGRTVGPSLTAAAKVTEDELLEGEFDALGAQFAVLVTRAHEQALEWFATLGMSETEIEEWREQQEDDRDAAWLLLLALLMANARLVLYGQQRTDDEVGEADPTLTVPPSIVRQALARAGGAQVGSASTVTVSGGVVTATPAAAPGGAVPGAAGAGAGAMGDGLGGAVVGPRTLAAFPRVGLAVVGWRWNYGDPAARQSNFAPHLALSGVEFADWSDPVLSFSGWPGFGRLFPGDHRGCLCDVVPLAQPAGTSPN